MPPSSGCSSDPREGNCFCGFGERAPELTDGSKNSVGQRFLNLDAESPLGHQNCVREVP
jgi:hypothetical protein